MASGKIGNATYHIDDDCIERMASLHVDVLDEMVKALALFQRDYVDTGPIWATDDADLSDHMEPR